MGTWKPGEGLEGGDRPKRRATRRLSSVKARARGRSLIEGRKSSSGREKRRTTAEEDAQGQEEANGDATGMGMEDYAPGNDRNV